MRLEVLLALFTFLFHFNFPFVALFLPCSFFLFVFISLEFWFCFPFSCSSPSFLPYTFPFPRSGCSCGIQPARRGSAASFPATSVTAVAVIVFDVTSRYWAGVSAGTLLLTCTFYALEVVVLLKGAKTGRQPQDCRRFMSWGEIAEHLPPQPMVNPSHNTETGELEDSVLLKAQTVEVIHRGLAGRWIGIVTSHVSVLTGTKGDW